ncbi:class I SAM-dependent methyltransferase [Nocardia mexicana]|uniref:class I SAM-dependent methyltransferase n=1 Tax=Nocardia mexicana TaxID=279262 RepID=UPI001B85F33D|nr:class I SAM-dependent methyltransferase [Nocardia mexicana]
MVTDYRTLNRANWDDRAPLHAASPDYALDRFRGDPSFVSDTVRFDLPRLGDIDGLRGVHLQCHLGTDTISLARLGATMTGLDFSPASVHHARELAEQSGAAIDFVEADVYDAVAALGSERFDLVFTGIGALCWLPDIERWARTVAGLLRPGGRLFLRDGHPFAQALDETQLPQLAIGYPYFETAEPQVYEDAATYVDTDGALTRTVTHQWSHGIGEIVTAVLGAGLTVTGLEEHDSAPWPVLPEGMERGDDGEWRLIEHRERMPFTFTLQARKPA